MEQIPSVNAPVRGRCGLHPAEERKIQ